MGNFFANFNTSKDVIKGINSRLTNLAVVYTEYLISGSNSIHGIKPLRQACLRLQDDSEQFT